MSDALLRSNYAVYQSTMMTDTHLTFSNSVVLDSNRCQDDAYAVGDQYPLRQGAVVSLSTTTKSSL